MQSPTDPDGLIAEFDVSDESVATSGDYMRYFDHDGHRYHHILDPHTGRPARDIASVSVLSNDPIAADCYTKVVFVLGRERGLAFLNARPDLRGVIVRETSPGHLAMLWSDSLAARVQAP